MKTMYEVGRRETNPDYIRELSVVKETGSFIFYEDAFGRVRRQKKETSWTTNFETKEEAIKYVAANAERANQKHKEGILRDAAPELLDALEDLLARDERNTCQHEETHRGGSIWEICNSCGIQWSDDRNPKPEWQDPEEWVKARAIIAKAKGE